ncbi:Guanosine-3',5'-bis(diphosphate) 3'-pyrophosphohydrolase / GTP pyrophosphokinase, (p)ppGpp synthetase II [hydrothermal vent metagenome]|uniref:Guanosine-3',5'-bis(Diphosphate) 3'-pyrophosphohydrolase / GTP pyrophosphokinase, (P)ppGpp synthetase II n=1 Tax=hydrothermal vent metagenome TaxID=652676 RepID=A0A3B1C891_9ZZZZ
MIRPEFIIEELRRNMPEANIEMVWRAYAFSARMHKGQKRVSGEPYLNHPLEVANILAHMKLGHVSIAVALLHDTVEDTGVTTEDIKKLFGEEVMQLVDGVTKISQLKFSSKEEHQAENFRKMILAMSKDIRVILVKLADRIHNMRTLHYLSPEKQKAIAGETLEIYAPLANRLGMGWIKTELENNSFKYLHPKDYQKIKNEVEADESEREAYIGEIVAEVKERLKQEGYDVEVQGRPKHLYSIFSKMRRQGIDFKEVLDLMGIRIITNLKQECYAILGLLHNIYKPIPGKLDDYIALPKENMYQSLHTTIVGPKGRAVEFQIRSRAMDLVSEEGIAAHWRYKEGSVTEGKHDEEIVWLRRLLDWQQEVKNPKKFLEFVKIDLFSDEVYVFTPNQEVKALPKGSTPIDFAYAVHTDIGSHCIGAKINGKLASLRQELNSGDIVEALTSQQAHPSRDWLKIVKTSKARTKISSYINQAEKNRALELGREFLEKELVKLGVDPKSRITESVIMPHAQASGYTSVDSLFVALGLGKMKMAPLLAKLAPKETVIANKKKTFIRSAFKKLISRSSQKEKFPGVRIQNMNDLLIRFAQCCNPVPGDSIKGFVSRGRGLVIHTVDCPNAVGMGVDSERSVDVEWDVKKKGKHLVMLAVKSKDKPGMLSQVTGIIADSGSNITEATVKVGDKSKGQIYVTFEVADLTQLQKLMNSLMRLPGVISVERIKDRRSFKPARLPKKA